MKGTWKIHRDELSKFLSRFDLSAFSDEEEGRIDDQLRQALKKCMGSKADDMNIARDALIALSSLDCDYFITSDRCLHKSWLTVIVRNDANRRTLEREHQFPEIIYARPSPEKVSQEIIKRASGHFSLSSF